MEAGVVPTLSHYVCILTLKISQELVIWLPIRGDFTVNAWADTPPWSYSVGKEMLLCDCWVHSDKVSRIFIYCWRLFLTKQVCPPCYNPYLVFCHFLLFSKIKLLLKIRRFQIMDKLRRMWPGNRWQFQKRTLLLFTDILWLVSLSWLLLINLLYLPTFY